MILHIHSAASLLSDPGANSRAGGYHYLSMASADPSQATTTKWTRSCRMYNHDERPSKLNVRRNWSPFCKVSERRSNAHGAHRDGPWPTTHPSSDRQRHMRRIFQRQHLPMTFKIHINSILLVQRQSQIRKISVLLDGWRTKPGRLFNQTPPHQTSLVKIKHIYCPHSGRH